MTEKDTTVSHDPTTKKATPNPALTYTTAIEGGSGNAKDNAVNPLVEDKRWPSAAGQPPQTNSLASSRRIR